MGVNVKYKIPFNKPYLSGMETEYIREAVLSGKLSGNGAYTKKCQTFFEQRYGFSKTLLTTSCTDALEMCAMLIDIKPERGDEIIVPSYTFVSSALAFERQGAKIIFADSEQETPNVDVQKIEALITDRTRAIVVVHYAGVSVDMDAIMELSRKYGLFVIEDAAQAIESYWKGRPLGGIGHLGTFSFHETKNIISGEGGLLVINDDVMIDRAEVLWEKGTNRASFFRGEVNKYGWKDLGSSFLPSETTAAFLFAQLENLESIQEKRIALWNGYNDAFQVLKDIVRLPFIPDSATNNGHMYYLITSSLKERTELISFLKEKGIYAVFHYLSLHKSDYYRAHYEHIPDLPMSDYYSDHLVRLPMFYELTVEEQEYISEAILQFYGKSKL